jgi:hypothetical protein
MSSAADDAAKPRISASSLLQQLQMAGDHIPLLQSIMQRELQSITPTSQQLQLAHIAQRQRSAGAPQAPQHTPQNSNRVEVVPLAGLCLMHLMADMQQQQQQCNAHTSSSSTNAEQAGHSRPYPAEAAAATTAADLAPGDLLEAMKHCSLFVNALHSELCSLRKVSSSCYTQIMQQLAAVGRDLPPAAAGSNRRSSSGSNDVPAHPRDSSRVSEAAPYAHAAGAADSNTNNSNSSGNNNSSSGSYYGRDLDLPLLQQQADNAALDLIHLEDCIISSVTRLSCLAQQYDIMITAALAAAAEYAGAAADARLAANDLHHHHQQQQQGGTAGEAPGRTAGARKGHGLLGPLLDAVRGHKGSKDAGQQQQRPEAIEYVFMQPGVCSHSNAGQVHSYSAGKDWAVWGCFCAQPAARAAHWTQVEDLGKIPKMSALTLFTCAALEQVRAWQVLPPCGILDCKAHRLASDVVFFGAQCKHYRGYSLTHALPVPPMCLCCFLLLLLLPTSCAPGVPADVYSTSVNKLLRHSDCSERVIWMLSVIYARLRHASEAAESAAAAGCGDQAGAAAGAKQWSAPDKVCCVFF